MTTAPQNGHGLIQSDSLALGFQAIDQVGAAAGALRSIGVQCQANASGADLQRQYDQWGPLSLQKIARAAEHLDNAKTGLEALRAHTASAAARLAAAWPDTAGHAASENYQAASARAEADLAKVGQFSRALGVYQGALVQLLDSLRTQAQLIFDNLLGSLGQYRTADAVVHAVRQAQDVMLQRPVAPNAQNVVDALRQQLQNQVAAPTEYAVAQLQRLLDMAQQQGASATELLASTLQGVNTDPYKAPEFPIADEPDCGCRGDHDEKKPDRPSAAVSAQAAPAAGGWPGAGPSGSTGSPDSSDAPDSPGSSGNSDTSAAGSSRSSRKDVGPDDSAEGEGAAEAVSPAGDDTASGESSSAPELGFLGDIGSVVGSAIGSVADALGQIVGGLASAAGSGVGSVGTALNGTNFSNPDGDDAQNATEALADEAATADDSDAETFDSDPETEDTSDSCLDAEADLGSTEETDLDSTAETAGDSAAQSLGSLTVTPENSAVPAQPGGDTCPTVRQHAEPVSAVQPPQVGHGDFEIASNQLQVPAPKEDVAVAPQADAILATTPVSAEPSTVPSF